MVRPPKEFVEAARNYVCVRVLNMDGIDLSQYRFDYDLTFAALLMNSDGTIYHRYGGRDPADASGYLSLPSLVKVLKNTLEDHAAYMKKPAPPKIAPKRTIMDIPTFASKKKPKCVHCHMVNEAERSLAQQNKTWSRDEIWLWPLPDRIGLKVEKEDAALIREIEKGSAAEAAGLKKGDRLLTLNGQRVRTLHDLQFVLDSATRDAVVLAVELEGGARTEIKLKKGWKEGTPLDLSWRPSMWGLKPQPGFGGKRLTAEELKKEGLQEGSFAFRIGYIVDWGDQAHLGQNVKAAGLQKGDLVVSVGGRSDFESEKHFQAWFRLTLKSGTKVTIELIRAGKKLSVELPVLE